MKNRTKKSVKKAWDFTTTLIVSLFFLVLAAGMASGSLALPNWAWLNWIPSVAVMAIGWVFIVSIVLNIGTSIWNLFTR